MRIYRTRLEDEWVFEFGIGTEKEMATVVSFTLGRVQYAFEFSRNGGFYDWDGYELLYPKEHEELPVEEIR